MKTDHQAVTRAGLARVALALLWGSNFLWIKLALGGFNPVQLVFARLLLGFVVLAPIALVRGLHFPRGWLTWGHREHRAARHELPSQEGRSGKLALMEQDDAMTKPTGYEQDMPAVQAHVEKFERAWAKVRSTHGGTPSTRYGRHWPRRSMRKG